ncbi:3-dehydroquinate synthase [Lagierella sp.]|uniref:3-dehydroquinate synthase n=1 Tax=Lagierella sp. TaxID=2849657 RepID=UPI0026272CEE|nr:3-dehydroquinate synthase [Lagierella sp.]
MNKEIKIAVSESYSVNVGRDNFELILKYLDKNGHRSKVAIITDDNVKKLHLNKLTTIFRENKVDYFVYSILPGEKSKNLTTIAEIMDFLASNKMSRSDMVIAFGGGVVGDIAGFAASIYLRGIDYIQIPTTLLSAVDSSVGGKTGVDLKKGKNLVGTFKQPKSVICNLNTFNTLSKEEFNNGIFECIKYGVLFDEDYFNIFLEEDFDYDSIKLSLVVEKAIEFKAKVVIEDEFDYGKRRLLNLGHTFGHGIEQASNYNIKHGFAVGKGIEIISQISYQRGKLKNKDLQKILLAIKKYNMADFVNFGFSEVLDYVLVDKKIFNGKITMIIPEKIGKCYLEEMDLQEVKELYRNWQREF